MTNFRHQIKSNLYYVFWGICTVTVVAGQVYVGTGYRQMSESMDGISADINLLVEVLTMPLPKTMPVPRSLYEPILPPPTGGYSDFHERDMVIR